MSKRVTKILSLILTLVMFLSVSTPAFAFGGDLGRGWDREIGEDEIRDFEPEEEVEEVEEYDYFSAYDSDLAVTVEAPLGALPTLAEVHATRVEVEDIRDAVNSVVDGEPNILLALDISFWLNGIEIEPEEAVRVKIAAPELEDKTNLTLVHIPDEAEPETVNLIPDEDLKFALGTNEIAFESKDFSVYAVVDKGEGGDQARAVVKFHGLNDAVVATYYVKNGDKLAPADPDNRDPSVQYLDDYVVDPGVGGQVPEGQIFTGWYINATKDYTVTTPAKTIAQVREWLAGQTFNEGDEVHVWAVLYKVFTITYMDENNITLGTDEIKILPSEASASYTVSKDYTPVDPNKSFLGWNPDNYPGFISNPKYEGEAVQPPFKMGTTMTISGNVIFTVNAPKGHWLAFDENGKGATYNAPQFVKDEDTTHAPSLAMVRLGYEFKGWYTVRYEDNATVDSSKAFTFGNPLTENTVIYAKWDTVSTARYTVLYWKQNTAGNGYDFDHSQNITGNVGTAIVVNNSGSTVTVTGANNYTIEKGFKYGHADSGKVVNPEGNTIVNVYVDRETVTFNFYVYSSWQWRLSQTMTGLYGSTLESNGYEWPTDYDWYLSYSGGSGSGTRRTFMDAFIPAGVSGMTHNFYASTPSGRATIYFYKQNADLNGYTRANTVSVPSNSSFTMSDKYNGFYVYSYSTNGTSYSTNVGTPNSQGYYNSVEYGNQLHIRFNRKVYNILFTDGVYVDGNNNPIPDAVSQGELKVVQNVTYGADTSSYNKGNANYYEPTAPIGYVFEGWYIDDACTSPYTFTTMPEGITVYAKWRQIQYRVFMHPNAKLPNGQNDTTLSWGDEEQDENHKQAMNFRVSYMGTISMPTGTRGEYEFIGWFTKDGAPFNMDSKFTEDLVKDDYDKTDSANYTDKMNKYGEIQGQGWNSDLTGWDDDNDPTTPGKDRFWVSKKIDLYGKWSAFLTGAEGIGIIYDLNGGTNGPEDTNKYKDNVNALAGIAPVPPAEKRFQYWVVQEWVANESEENGGHYADTDTIVYPGAPFTVLKSLSQAVELEGDQIIYEQATDPETGEPLYDDNGYPIPAVDQDGNPIKKIFMAYTMQLRAEYGPAQTPTDTHITFYANGGDYSTKITGENILNGNVTLTYTDLMINQSVTIPTADKFTRPGYKFLGWAKVTEPEGAFVVAEDGTASVDETKYSEQTGLTLWLKAKDNGKFDEMNGTTVKNEDVTEVAADEAMPYDAIYAVWEYKGLAYVFHSSDGTVDIIDFAAMEAANETTFNLQAAVKSGYLYGGYFHGYLNVTDAEAIAVAGKGTAATTYKYNGSSTYARLPKGDGTDATKIVKYWNKTGAKGAYTEDGRSLVPAEDTVYYLREVPEAFLGFQLQLVYDWGLTPEGAKGKQIDNLYMLTTIDNTYYTEGGFHIVVEKPSASSEEESKNKAEFYASFSFKSDKSADDAVVIKAVDMNYIGGYVGYYDGAAKLIADANVPNDSLFTVNAYWTTLDGVTVFDTVYRTFSVGDKSYGSDSACFHVVEKEEP